jgi:hypothetical protein
MRDLLVGKVRGNEVLPPTLRRTVARDFDIPVTMRKRFNTAASPGLAEHHEFRTAKPSGYPIPENGPVGQLVRVQNRQDAVFAAVFGRRPEPGNRRAVRRDGGVDRAQAHDDNELAPDAEVKGRWYSLQHRFVVMRGEAVVPMPPITGKVEGERAAMVVRERLGD